MTTRLAQAAWSFLEGSVSVLPRAMAERERNPMNHPTHAHHANVVLGEEGRNAGPMEKVDACLKLVDEYMKTTEKMHPRKFNLEQCDYLVDKLKEVVHNASAVLKVPSGKCHGTPLSKGTTKPCESRSHVDSLQRVNAFKFLLVLAKQIHGFVEVCCKDAWIQAAVTLANVSEYVSSLGFNLEICKRAFEEWASTETLTLKEVDNICELEVKCVEQKAKADSAALREKLESKQKSLTGDEKRLCTYLLERLSKIQGISSFDEAAPSYFRHVMSFLNFGNEAERLGEGASGTVEKGKWLGIPVAQKCFPGANNLAFDKEVNSLGKLWHSNIVSTYANAMGNRRCVIVMQLMEKDLSEMPCRGQDSPFFILEAVDIILQISEGVNYLHSQGIVHRDLKASNILVESVKVEGCDTGYVHVKVADFGHSKTKVTSTSYSEQIFNVGTSRWMAPEIINSNAAIQVSSSKKGNVPKYEKKSDVYSFAMVCYEVLTGNMPFPEVDNEKVVKEKVQSGERPPLPDCCPLQLKDLIQKCWQHLPVKRPSFDVIRSELRYLKYLLLTDISVYNTSHYKNGLFTYSRNFLVDRPDTEPLKDPYTTMMDRVRHRLDPFPGFDDDAEDENNIESNGSDENSDESNCAPDMFSLETLMELLILSDVLVQIPLLQLLLEERFAIPVVVPFNEDFNDYRHLLEALSFVQVKVGNQETLSIAENTSLPRVVFVSNRRAVSKCESADMAGKVMNCTFPSKDIKSKRGDGSTILELGVGFLRSSTKQLVQYVPCLAFCVSGDHNKLGTILEKVADIVIIETDPEAKSLPSWIGEQTTRFFWSTGTSKRGKKQRTGCDHIRGKYSDISTEITRHVLKTKIFKEDTGGRTSLAECFHSLNPLNRPTSVSNIEELEAIRFDTVRMSLALQTSYTAEAKLYFKSLRKRGEAEELQKQMQRYEEDRRRAASAIRSLPILRIFIQLLSKEQQLERSLGILHLQRLIDRKLQETLHSASKKVIDAFDELQLDQNKVGLRGAYQRAMDERVNQMLGLEHLWRELSHIFVADPENQKHLPQLAANHLLDGFPLEILDGDAAKFHREWVETILIELDAKLHASLQRKAKVFVLSVVGLQSSGKSTLLNVMFGTKLKTSAGMCTRGVFLQLVKSEWPEFDHVLILDTMGLRAPEFFGQEDSRAQDNRLATFAVLPADACVVMVANEEDNGLKEVLPMVLLAFKGSALAEKVSGKIQSKLFFAYRGVDVNDKGKLGDNQRKLQRDLSEAASAIADFTDYGTGKKRVGTVDRNVEGPLNNFRINSDDEKASDVKFFGNLKRGSKPPEDTPDWDYGTKVKELREYINERVLDGGHWRAHGLVEWKDYLGMVWQSITEADFELSFSTHSDHANYHYLQVQIATLRQKVGKTWQGEFERVTNNPEVRDEHGCKSCWRDSKRRVKGTVDIERINLDSILDRRQFQKWKVAETKRWEDDCSANENHWDVQFQDWIDGTLGFDNAVKGYITKIQLKISGAARTHPNIDSPGREQDMKDDFDKLFEGFLENAQMEHPPMAQSVERRILGVYVDNPVVGRQFNFGEVADLDEDKKFGEAVGGRRFGEVADLDEDKFGEAVGGRRFGEVADLDEDKKFGEAVGGRRLNYIDLLRNAVKSILGADRDSQIAQNILLVLIPTMQSSLGETKQYSGHFVESIIQLTQECVIHAGKHVQRTIHEHIRALLTKELTSIQEEWDNQHNVAMRLEKQRDVLWRSYLNHANKVAGTQMLSSALSDLLGAVQLLDGFKARIAKSVSTNLQSREQWVYNWKMMRAHMDLHLIELIKSEDIGGVLKLVSNGTRHYQLIVDKLIRKEMDERMDLSGAEMLFKDLICDALAVAAVTANHSKTGTPKALVFQQSLIKSLRNLSPDLARGVSVILSEETCSKYSDDVDFFQIRDEVSACVKGVELNINDSFEEVINIVRDRLRNAKADGVRARCDAECPRCRVTCFKEANHTGEHDSLHQPAGLCGIHFNKSKKLVHRSCSKSVAWDLKMLVECDGEDVSVPYRDWASIYKDWMLPSEGLGTVEVREYIFAHFQKELVEFFGARWKACDDIPDEFHQHSLETLQLNLRNLIRSASQQ